MCLDSCDDIMLLTTVECWGTVWSSSFTIMISNCRGVQLASKILPWVPVNKLLPWLSNNVAETFTLVVNCQDRVFGNLMPLEDLASIRDQKDVRVRSPGVIAAQSIVLLTIWRRHYPRTGNKAGWEILENVLLPKLPEEFQRSYEIVDWRGSGEIRREVQKWTLESEKCLGLFHEVFIGHRIEILGKTEKIECQTTSIAWC